MEWKASIDMGTSRLLLFLCAAFLVHGITCVKKQSFYQWKFNSFYPVYKDPVTVNMTTLDKSLADNITAYEVCYNAARAKNPWEIYRPEQRQYKFTKEVFGRKKRDVLKNVKYYTKTGSYVEIPFLISANWTECDQRRIAITLRKFETKTCIKFVPFESIQKHPHVFMMINEIRLWDTFATAPFGRLHVAGTTLDGKTLTDGGVLQLPNNNMKPIEHELMHTLGFIHPHDSPYREGSSEWWAEKTWYPKPEFKEKDITKIGPWEKNSAVSSVGGDKFLTDWDTWKINKFYDCKVTAFGNQAINMAHTPPPPVNIFEP